MTIQEFEHILKQGEGYNIEFKRNLNKEITKEICSFLNSSGGKIIIGINDDNTVHGIKLTNGNRSEIYSFLQPVTPRPEITVSDFNYKGKDIIIVDVEPGKDKPYITAGLLYVRIGANAQKLTTPDEMRDFFQTQNKVYFEQAVEQKFKFENDFDSEKYKKFIEQTDVNPKIEIDTVLSNLRLFNDKKRFINAGILFFAKNPEKFFPNATIRCILFKGTDKRFIADDKILTGSLPQQYFAAIEYLKQKLDLRYEIENTEKNQRIEKLEIPEIVFREAIVNAIVHRDYFEQGAKIHIEIYDDRVEITNPGGLVSGIPEKDFGKRSMSRNPIIFGMFQRLRLVEQIGSGIARMREAMKDENLSVPEFSLDKMFVVTFLRPVDFKSWILAAKQNLNDTQIEILKAISRNPNVTYNNMCVILATGKTTIFNNVKILRDKGIIYRVGSDKNGYWSIKFVRFN